MIYIVVCIALKTIHGVCVCVFAMCIVQSSFGCWWAMQPELLAIKREIEW